MDPLILDVSADIFVKSYLKVCQRREFSFKTSQSKWSFETDVKAMKLGKSVEIEYFSLVYITVLN